MKKSQKVIKKSRLDKTAERAMREAVGEVVAKYKKNHLPLAVWKKNKVILIGPRIPSGRR